MQCGVGAKAAGVHFRHRGRTNKIDSLDIYERRTITNREWQFRPLVDDGEKQKAKDFVRFRYITADDNSIPAVDIP